MINKGVAALVIGLSLVVASAGIRPAGATTISGTGDCDSNAVIRCGVTSSKDMASDFQDSSVDHIYSYFGISQADINGFDGQAVAGSVTRHNDVVVNGKIVAKNAMTAGRQNMPGSNAVTSGTTTFYVRPPSVSFRQPSLPAYVVMHNGRFAFAVIASCGNPVIATPTTKPKTPAPPVQQTAPPPVQTQTQIQTVTVTPPEVESANTTLPNTGPGNILGIGGLVSIASGLGHFIYTRRKSLQA